MTEPKPPVSFIGLGAMGFGMATTLVREGFPVTGFDVGVPTLERFQKEGGLAAATPASAVEDKAICVCMVATAQQAQSVLLEGDSPAIQALPNGAVILLCSTVPCGYVKSLEKQLQEKGRGDIDLIDCPVSGGAGRAASGELSIMVGASDHALAKGLPVLKAMSDPAKLYIVNGGVGAGSNMKMCHQVLASNQILSASEGMGFAQHLGLDLDRAANAINSSTAWSWMFENRLPRMLHPDFLPLASATTIILKDTSIITSEARTASFSTPMTSTAEQVYFSSLGLGHGSIDDSSLIRIYTNGISKPELKLATTSAETESDRLSLVLDLLCAIHLCSAIEALAFAHHVHLDLHQVLELCNAAAGGSTMLSQAGPGIIEALSGTTDPTSTGSCPDISSMLEKLSRSVAEGQTLKMPLHLGNQAMNLIQQAAKRCNKGSTLGLRDLVAMWSL